MKKAILLSFLILSGSLILYSQVPQAMTYKAIAKDDWGVALPNKEITLRFSIIQGSEYGYEEYIEVQSTITNKFGLMDVQIGEGAPQLGSFSSIDWSLGPYYIKIEMDPQGGTNFRLEDPAHQLLSVPFALYSGSAYGSFSGDYNDLINSPFALNYSISNQLLKYNDVSGKWESWTPNYLTTEVDGSVLNEIQDLSLVTDILKITNNTIATEIDLSSYKADGSETKLLAGNNVTVTGSGTISNPYSINSTNSTISGINLGDMQYWNGTEWVLLSSGGDGSILKMINGIPTWSEFSYPAILNTSAATEISSNSAIVGGNIISDGGSAILEYGMCWSTMVNPTIADSKTVDGSGIGIFTSYLTGLVVDSTYYVRSYATNSVDTYYGNEVSFAAMAPLTIGDSYQGGIIAYILQPADPGYVIGETHGLIAAPSDQSASAPWGCQSTEIAGADGTTLGTGNQNTIDIVNDCDTSGIAAQLCFDLVLNGYSDWYLPSRAEVDKLYINKTAIGGLADADYWSSSEYDGVQAWLQYFPYGDQYTQSKDRLYHVRAIRSF